MKRKAFTLLEIIFTLIIMGIIATIAFPTYQNFVEDAHARVCETNLKALKTALDIYAIEHDTMPGALGALPQEYINKAYAQVMQRPDAWKTKLAYAFLEWRERGLAYADPNFLYTLTRGNIGLITCPSASSPPQDTGGGNINTPSYGISNLLRNMTSAEYRELLATNPAVVLIADSNGTVLGGIAKRHLHVFSRVPYGISVARDGTIVHED